MNGRWEIEERIDAANQYRAENNLDIPEWTVESYLYDSFDASDADFRDGSNDVQYSWYGENRTEKFTAKQYNKGPIYSKFAW